MANLSFVAMTTVIVFLHLCDHPTQGAETELKKFAPLKVGSFNVQHFGKGYLKRKQLATEELIQIMNRYDIVSILETRDKSGKSLSDLKKKLESKTGVKWKYVASERLGSNRRYLEQYVFFYKVGSAKVIRTYQVNKKTHIYSRPPFCVEFSFKSRSEPTSKVVFLALHTPPSKTPNELNALPQTIKSVAKKIPDAKGVIAMGDFNADCNYLTGPEKKVSKLFNDKDLKEFINNNVDTTSKKTNCAYDRVVYYGKELTISNAGAYNFEKELNLTYKQALKISDHYPVEFYLDAVKSS